MNSTPGIAAAMARLSCGDSTQNAVASAPAVTASGAVTVALRMCPAGRAVRGSTMCE
jgi:hypothetical protein